MVLTICEYFVRERARFDNVPRFQRGKRQIRDPPSLLYPKEWANLHKTLIILTWIEHNKVFSQFWQDAPLKRGIVNTDVFL